MTKNELIEQIVEKSRLTKRDIRFVFDQIIAGIEEALASGERVQISGFGSFERKWRSQRKGRNPNTGQIIILQNRFVPYFKPGKRLRERILKKSIDNSKVS